MCFDEPRTRFVVSSSWKSKAERVIRGQLLWSPLYPQKWPPCRVHCLPFSRHKGLHGCFRMQRWTCFYSSHGNLCHFSKPLFCFHLPCKEIQGVEFLFISGKRYPFHVMRLKNDFCPYFKIHAGSLIWTILKIELLTVGTKPGLWNVSDEVGWISVFL